MHSGRHNSAPTAWTGNQITSKLLNSPSQSDRWDGRWRGRGLKNRHKHKRGKLRGCRTHASQFTTTASPIGPAPSPSIDPPKPSSTHPLTAQFPQFPQASQPTAFPSLSHTSSSFLVRAPASGVCADPGSPREILTRDRATRSACRGSSCPRK